MISDQIKLALIKTAPTLSHIGLIELVEHECELASQRTWVGLNWSDLPEEWVGNPAFMEGAKWAETKLKEKNT